MKPRASRFSCSQADIAGYLEKGAVFSGIVTPGRSAPAKSGVSTSGNGGAALSISGSILFPRALVND